MYPWILVAPVVVVVALAFASAASRRCRSTRRDISQQEYKDGLIHLGFRSLHEYRQSELWRATKRRYRKSDYPQRCLVCGSKHFDLHHRSYARLGAEELFDLVPLCRLHHDQLHELLDGNAEVCVKDTHDYLALLMGNKVVAAVRGRSDQQQSVSARSREVPRSPKRRAQIAQQRYRGGQRWMPEEDEILLRDFDAGVSVDQLAERLRRGVRAVEVRLYKLGRLPRGSWSAPQSNREDF